MKTRHTYNVRLLIHFTFIPTEFRSMAAIYIVPYLFNEKPEFIYMDSIQQVGNIVPNSTNLVTQFWKTQYHTKSVELSFEHILTCILRITRPVDLKVQNLNSGGYLDWNAYCVFHLTFVTYDISTKTWNRSTSPEDSSHAFVNLLILLFAFYLCLIAN